MSGKADDPVPVYLHPALAGVLMALPHPGTIVPQWQREKILDAIETVFGLMYQDRQPTDGR